MKHSPWLLQRSQRHSLREETWFQASAFKRAMDDRKRFRREREQLRTDLPEVACETDATTPILRDPYPLSGVLFQILNPQMAPFSIEVLSVRVLGQPCQL